MSNLHGQIMNVPVDRGSELGVFSSRPEAYRLGHRDARHAAAELANEADEQIEKLEAFKTYVHQRLDGIGVPYSIPESEHDKAGCRVGGRLDWVEGHINLLESEATGNERMARNLENKLFAERGVSDKLAASLKAIVAIILAEVEALRK